MFELFGYAVRGLYGEANEGLADPARSYEAWQEMIDETASRSANAAGKACQLIRRIMKRRRIEGPDHIVAGQADI